LHRGDLAETLSDLERDWLSAALFVEVRVQYYKDDNTCNKTGEDEITFIAGVNTDFEYGRDKGLIETYEETFQVDDLTPAKVKDIFKTMYESI
jgi:hypothetical protein